jgi:hypothetical protein
MLEMHQVGAYAPAQDEQSCVVFGMLTADDSASVRQMVALTLKQNGYEFKPSNRNN